MSLWGDESVEVIPMALHESVCAGCNLVHNNHLQGDCPDCTMFGNPKGGGLVDKLQRIRRINRAAALRRAQDGSRLRRVA